MSDTAKFTALLDGLVLASNAANLADKGYASAKNSGYLVDRGLTDCIMIKASRGHPLKEEERERNRSLSKFRYVVEQTFGSLKGRYGLFCSRYVGKLKTQAEFMLCSIGFNLREAAKMI